MKKVWVQTNVVQIFTDVENYETDGSVQVNHKLLPIPAVS